ncbi:hypothetical protein [Nocardia amamiensis]|uniref:hypothetical protein n=1 Tax=Nocardia amamiensis TaxID=404578 RepID=UPI000AD097C9|nr:hypothetical protein [Nocardia amamiensis]
MAAQASREIDAASLLGLTSPRPDVPQSSLELAEAIASTSGRRAAIPLRWSFTHAPADDGGTISRKAPLARLIGSGGRGGSVPVKLYLALIWRSSAPPHNTDYAARKWAELLGLPDPETKGSRRVTEALRTLEAERLVRITREPGEPSTVQILDESGSGAAYELPSTAYHHARSLEAQAKSADRKKKHRKMMEANLYSKIPQTLWTNGHIQDMSSAALAMLLILMSNSRASDGAEIWWSTQNFPARYGISPATRARGTRELADRNLLQVTKRLVPNSPNNTRALAREKVRNVYTLINDAKLPEATNPDPQQQQQRPARRRKRKAAQPA